MAHGLPDHPPDGLEFLDASELDCCPACGWDPADDALLDPPRAHELGVLLAVEAAEGAVFGTMQGVEPLGYYFRCPNKVMGTVEVPHPSGYEEYGTIYQEAVVFCGTLFTLEVENQFGAMA